MKKKIVINDKPTVRENNRHFVIFDVVENINIM